MVKVIHTATSLFLSLLLFSCGGGKQGSEAGTVALLDSIRYATGFTVAAHEGYSIAEVVDPWDQTKVLQRYILIRREASLPSNLPQGTIVRIPVQNVVVYSSVHVAMIDLLGQLDKVVGVCEPRYMNTPGIQERVKSGEIADLGEATAPNVEKMIDINAEVIFASPFQNMGYGTVEKLGIPIVEGADYMETSPLGRTEWLRFYGLLFDRSEVADSLFSVTESSYMETKKLAEAVKEKPTVLAEKRYGATWFLPAGESYMAQLYADAGADYIFKDKPGAGNLNMSFETVLENAIHANFWLIKYHEVGRFSYSDLRNEYTPYENFDAFKNRNIYAANTAEVPYYEETPIHPDYLLKDLVKIFHPDVLPAYELRYFHKLDD